MKILLSFTLVVSVSQLSCIYQDKQVKENVLRDTVYNVWSPDSTNVTHYVIHGKDTAVYGAAR